MDIKQRLTQLLQWLHRGSFWWLLAMLFFFGYDIFHDVLSEGFDFHVVLETMTLCAVTAVLIGEWRRNGRLSTNLAQASSYGQRLSGQFSDYVREAFSVWSFSTSEQEVAWLLLKGFTFAEIAAFRGVQEKTVRQQASAIYAKSGCKNRNEFLAHFIQDLLQAEHLQAEVLSASEDAGQFGAKTTSAMSRSPE
jgi:DNA-binding CsgD family transcriptional regulator